MTRGLVLGKFAPFHRGHQTLVEQSLAETDETVVLIYDSPEVTRVPLARRAGWIRSLYPAARVVEGHGAPAASGHDPAIMRMQEEYIRRMMPGPVTHFFSSEWYGAHVAAALGAKDRRVDPDRGRVAISGTVLRSAPFEHRHLVAPEVYRDLLRRVVLLGAESTGKSTLAEALALSLGTRCVSEYGREFWTRHRDPEGRLTPVQLVELAREHRRREDVFSADANRILISDTDARTTRQYARWYHEGFVHAELHALAEAAAERYHLVVLCGVDIPYVEDGTRAGLARREKAQAEIVAEVKASGVPWIEASGTVHERVAQVATAIRALGLDRWA